MLNSVLWCSDELALASEQTFEDRARVVDGEPHASGHEQRKEQEPPPPVGIHGFLREQIEQERADEGKHKHRHQGEVQLVAPVLLDENERNIQEAGKQNEGKDNIVGQMERGVNLDAKGKVRFPHFRKEFARGFNGSLRPPELLCL